MGERCLLCQRVIIIIKGIVTRLIKANFTLIENNNIPTPTKVNILTTKSGIT